MRIFRLWIDGRVHVVRVDDECSKCGSIMIVDNLNAELDCVEIGCNHSAPMMHPDLQAKWESMSITEKIEAYAIPKGCRTREKDKMVELIDASGKIYLVFSPDFPVHWGSVIDWLLQKHWIKPDAVETIAQVEVQSL